MPNDPNVAQFDRMIDDFIARTQTAATESINESAAAALESIKHGSAITGAPGQPVREGLLIGSFQMNPTDTGWEITSHSPYALAIEFGQTDEAVFSPERSKPRSLVGGYHSVDHTVTGWARLVENVVQQVTARIFGR